MAERIPKADGLVHLVALNLEDELKPRATAEGPASAAGEAAAAAAVVVVEEAVVVVEAAVAVVEEAADDASWRLWTPESFAPGSC